MSKSIDIIIAVKCTPQKEMFSNIKKAGLKAIELYLPDGDFNELNKIIRLCKSYPFRYAVHAPNDGHNLFKLAELVGAIGAEIVVCHNIYWEDEWEEIVNVFQNIKTKLCIENTYSVHEPVKFMRRYRLGRCLDLEHLQMECAGVYEEEFIRIIKQASHIHLTGYIYGSQLWHTHVHYSPKHNLYLMNLLKKADYSGFVVSEAKVSLQTYREFKRLGVFYQKWRSKFNNIRSRSI